MRQLSQANPVKVEEMTVLLKEKVKIRDKHHVEEVLNLLIQGGRQKLQLISDFDLTLTKQHVNGKPTLSSFGIFSLCKQLPHGYREKDEEMTRYYRPIEINPCISREEKTKYMLEWYHKAERLLSGFEFNIQELEQVVEKEGTELRDGTGTMLLSLHKAEVPVLVFSAGLGDIVSAVLKYHNVMHPNVHIISNYLRFNGLTVDGFQGTIIHSMNKNEHSLKDSDYSKIVSDRCNVLLLGDSIGDAGMAEGVPDVNAVLKIGFLYDRVDDRLEEFLLHFDIVLIDDQTMDVVNSILDMIL